MLKKNFLLPIIVFTVLAIMSSCQKNIDDLPISEKTTTLTNVTASSIPNESTESQIPEAITIEARTMRGCPTSNSCYFIASGAINDAGTTIVSDFIHENALYSPVVGTFQWTRTFIGTHGSITIRLQSSVQVPDEPCVLNETGHWIIISGTGDYAGLQGEGDETGIRNPCESKLDAVYKGLVR